MTAIHVAGTAVFLALLLGAAVAHAGDLPGPDTPGAINPAVTQSNIDQTICVAGWTATVRPPVSYTNKLKLAQMKALGLAGKPSDFEEDHRIPLGCAGNPTDPRNLSPESWTGYYSARAKDHVEWKSQARTCHHEITLAQCQAIFLGDWRVEFDRLYGHPAGAPPLPAAH